MVEKELKAMARRRLALEPKNHTLQPTALVHELFLRLFRKEDFGSISGRVHFFALASKVMRNILVDHARRRQSSKRGGGGLRFVGIEEALGIAEDPTVEFIDLDRALTKLEGISPRSARLIELCCFAGLTIKDASEVLGVSSRTLLRDWKVARSWLYKEINAESRGSLGPAM